MHERSKARHRGLSSTRIISCGPKVHLFLLNHSIYVKTFKNRSHFWQSPMKRVAAFGTFDIFHPGHEFYLKQASMRGDQLHVVVARDDTVQHLKGRAPLNNQSNRLAAVENLSYVHKAYLGKEDDKFALLGRIRPHVICLGYDQKTFGKDLRKVLEEKGLKAEIEVLPSFMPQKHKSSKLRKKHS